MCSFSCSPVLHYKHRTPRLRNYNVHYCQPVPTPPSPNLYVAVNQRGPMYFVFCRLYLFYPWSGVLYYNLSTRVSVPFRIGSPRPLSRNPWGVRGNTRFRVKGRRGRDDWRESLALCLLCAANQRGQCILFSVVFTPSPPGHHGSVWVLSVISPL